MPVSSDELWARARAGETGAVARLISRAEAGAAECRAVLAAIFQLTGRAHIIGITGVPGSGKSTLVGKLGAAIRRSGRRLAVIAVDPSSPLSGGAILGDRIRMGEIAGDPGVFLRSMAAHGVLGGLTRGVLEAADILGAAGFDVILIETVGVGQGEVDVARAVHTTVVVSAPGLGDDIQALKAGILEIADIHVVSKCDRGDADRTVAELKAMLAMGTPAPGGPSAPVPVIVTSAVRGEGIAELLAAIDRRWAALRESGGMAERRRRISDHPLRLERNHEKP